MVIYSRFITLDVCGGGLAVRAYEFMIPAVEVLGGEGSVPSGSENDVVLRECSEDCQPRLDLKFGLSMLSAN